MKINLLTLLILTTTATATEIVHKFSNPSFSGINQSAHYLTIDEQERTRKEKIRAEAQEYASTNGAHVSKNTNGKVKKLKSK